MRMYNYLGGHEEVQELQVQNMMRRGWKPYPPIVKMGDAKEEGFPNRDALVSAVKKMEAQAVHDKAYRARAFLQNGVPVLSELSAMAGFQVSAGERADALFAVASEEAATTSATRRPPTMLTDSNEVEEEK